MPLVLPLFAWHGGRSVPVTFLTSVPPEKSALNQAMIALLFSFFMSTFGLAYPELAHTSPATAVQPISIFRYFMYLPFVFQIINI
jgi:hypothetical protein